MCYHQRLVVVWCGVVAGVEVMDQVWRGEEDYFGVYVSSGQRQVGGDSSIQ
jgi:hypothetical protein